MTKTKLNQKQDKADLIISTRKNANLFVDLISDMEDENAKVVIKSINGVTKVCLHLLNTGMIILGSNTEKDKMDKTPEEIYSLWMKERYRDCCKSLSGLFDNAEESVRDLALMSMMSLLKAESKNVKNSDKFPVQLLYQIINSMISSETMGLDVAMVDSINKFQEKFCHFDDIRFYTMKALHNAISKKMAGNSLNLGVVFELMKDLKMPQFKNDEPLKSFYIACEHPKSACPKEQKKLFSSMWIDFLALELSPALYESVLTVLHDKVMPVMSNPLPLSDFLILSYSIGGNISLLALNGLFILMTSYNLDYPDFYKKLYVLLEPTIFSAPYISQFLNLLNTFLSSTHLPANLVAAFIKKLARISLVLPPTTLQAVSTLIINLLIRHPNCQVLVHKASSEAFLEDPYNEDEQNPMESNALKSSLWEMKSLQEHIYPMNAERCRKINSILPRIELPYANHTKANYTILLDKERKKRIKVAPEKYFTGNPSKQPSFLELIA